MAGGQFDNGQSPAMVAMGARRKPRGGKLEAPLIVGKLKKGGTELRVPTRSAHAPWVPRSISSGAFAFQKSEIREVVGAGTRQKCAFYLATTTSGVELNYLVGPRNASSP